MTHLEKILRKCVASCADCKILDDGINQPEGGIADFLLNGDQIVAELKCLEQDMAAKLQDFATELIDSRNLAIYGEVPFDTIIDAQRDRSDLKKTALKKIGGDRLQDDFKYANRQIKKTKARLGLSNSYGLLIVANTGNSPLKPDVAYWLLSVLLSKRKVNRTPLCSSIDCILYLTDLHDLGQLGGMGLKPAMVIARDGRPAYKELSEYLSNGFLRDWADFNNVPYFQAEKPYDKIRDFSRTPMRRLVDLKRKPRPPYVNAQFRLPAVCKQCGAVFAYPADRKPNEWRVNEPQKNFFVIGFVCSNGKHIADTRVADLSVDKDGDVINVFPWTGTLEDMLRPSWRDYIDRTPL